jgi:hypothetical protein
MHLLFEENGCGHSRSRPANQSQFTQRDRGQCLHDKLAFALLGPGFE